MIRISKKTGFTLIELLVVVSIIALLVSILLPALGRAREQARRAVCLSNAKQIGTGIYVYATANNFSLPVIKEFPNATTSYIGTVLFDLPQPVAEYMRKKVFGLVAEIFYCSSNKNPKKVANLEGYYTSHMAGTPRRDPWGPKYDNLGDGGWAITDYFWLMFFSEPFVPINGSPTPWFNVRYGDQNSPDEEYYSYGTISPVAPYSGGGIFHKSLNVRGAAGVPLVTDVTWTHPGMKNWNYGAPLNTNAMAPYLTNHMNTKKNEPAGGDILFLDNHATWKDFKDMELRYLRMVEHYW